MIKKRKKRGVLGLVVMAVLGLFAATVSPAGAISAPPESGAGISTGHSVAFSTGTGESLPIIGPHPLCAPVTQSIFEFVHTGTYTATQLTDPVTGQLEPKRAIYVGTAKVRVKAQELYYINPAGTFEDPLCTVPALVDVTVDVQTLDPDAPVPGLPVVNTAREAVNCPAGSGPPNNGQVNGHYNRTGEVAVIQFNARCKVTGPAVGFESGNTPPELTDLLLGQEDTVTTDVGEPTHTIEALQHPCLPLPPPEGTCTEVGDPESGAGIYTEFQGTYTET